MLRTGSYSHLTPSFSLHALREACTQAVVRGQRDTARAVTPRARWAARGLAEQDGHGALVQPPRTHTCSDLFPPAQGSRCRSITWCSWCTGSALPATFGSGASSSAVGVERGRDAPSTRCCWRSRKPRSARTGTETLSEPFQPPALASCAATFAECSANTALANPLNPTTCKGLGSHLSSPRSAAAQGSFAGRIQTFQVTV